MIAPGVSSMISSTPVAISSARIFRPSRPMIRPLRSSLGRSTTDTVVSMGAPLDRLRDDVFRLVGGHPRHPLQLALLVLDQRCVAGGLGGDVRFLLGEGLLARRQRGSRAFGGRQAVGDGVSLLGELFLECGQLLTAFAGLLFGLVQEVVRLFLGGQRDFLVSGLRVPLGTLDEPSRFVLGSADGVGGDTLQAEQPDEKQHRHGDKRGDDGPDRGKKRAEAHGGLYLQGPRRVPTVGRVPDGTTLSAGLAGAAR
jgi:hypothetical protein